MADYYPLIARAVDGLADRSKPMRQAVYDRARSALIGQLRSYDPPLPEADIENERLALEAAIERVEAAQRAPPPAPVPPPVVEPVPSSVEAPRTAHEVAPSPLPPTIVAPAPRPPEAPPRPAQPAVPAVPPPQAAPEPPVPQAPEAVRHREPVPAPVHEPAPESPGSQPEERPRLDEGAEVRPPSIINLPRTSRQSPPGAVVLAAPTSAGPVTAAEAEIEVPSDSSYADGEPAGPSFPAEQPIRPRVETRAPKPAAPGRARVLVLGSILLLVIGAIAIAAWHLRDTPAVELPSGPVAESEQAPAVPNKIEERVGGGTSAAPGQAAGPAPVRAESTVQQAILYEEDPSNPQVPKATVGRASWRLEPVSAGQGQPLDMAIRADVEVKDARFSLALLFRRNLDQTLPASHTVELIFSTPVGEPGRVVRDVGLLQFKQDVSARGTPVAGLPVPVRENLFLIGFSNLPSDIERNLDLMRREWIDLPIRFASGQRAIISFQKGTAGTQIVADALRQWRSGG